MEITVKELRPGDVFHCTRQGYLAGVNPGWLVPALVLSNDNYYTKYAASGSYFRVGALKQGSYDFQIFHADQSIIMISSSDDMK